MRLSEWMAGNGRQDEDLAAEIPCSTGAVMKWRTGQRVPRPPMMLRIIEITSGQVTANDFLHPIDAAAMAHVEGGSEAAE